MKRRRPMVTEKVVRGLIRLERAPVPQPHDAVEIAAARRYLRLLARWWYGRRGQELPEEES